MKYRRLVLCLTLLLFAVVLAGCQESQETASLAGIDSSLYGPLEMDIINQ